MKTRKISFVLLVAGLALSASSFGQGIYFGLGGGYGFSAAKMDFGPDQKTTSSTHNSSTTTSTVYTANSGSFGRGINLGLYGGYMVNKNIGVELGIGYLIGSTSKSVNETDNSTSNGAPFPNSSSTETDISTTSYKGSMLRLVPAIRIQCGENKIHPYAVAGLIIGLAGKLTYENVSTKTYTQSPGNPPNNTNDDNVWVYNGGVSWGLHSAIGAMYMVSDKIGIFGEIAANLQNFAPHKSVLTVSTSNGKDNLANMTTDQKETDYSSTYTTNSSSPAGTGSPSQSTTIRLPFSSIGITVGVHITLGGK
jgi:hypothetical protein